jgi:hypothetical protein
MARETAMAALDAPPTPPPFAWHDHDALSGLMTPHRFSVDVDPHSHVFRAASIDDFLRAELIDHPLCAGSRIMLEGPRKN